MFYLPVKTEIKTGTLVIQTYAPEYFDVDTMSWGGHKEAPLYCQIALFNQKKELVYIYIHPTKNLQTFTITNLPFGKYKMKILRYQGWVGFLKEEKSIFNIDFKEDNQLFEFIIEPEYVFGEEILNKNISWKDFIAHYSFENDVSLNQFQVSAPYQYKIYDSEGTSLHNTDYVDCNARTAMRMPGFSPNLIYNSDLDLHYGHDIYGIGGSANYFYHIEGGGGRGQSNFTQIKISGSASRVLPKYFDYYLSFQFNASGRVVIGAIKENAVSVDNSPSALNVSGILPKDFIILESLDEKLPEGYKNKRPYWEISVTNTCLNKPEYSSSYILYTTQFKQCNTPPQPLRINSPYSNELNEISFFNCLANMLAVSNKDYDFNNYDPNIINREWRRFGQNTTWCSVKCLNANVLNWSGSGYEFPYDFGSEEKLNEWLKNNNNENVSATTKQLVYDIPSQINYNSFFIKKAFFNANLIFRIRPNDSYSMFGIGSYKIRKNNTFVAKDSYPYEDFYSFPIEASGDNTKFILFLGTQLNFCSDYEDYYNKYYLKK